MNTWPQYPRLSLKQRIEVVESSWNVMAHGDAREGKWRGNWRVEWVASTLHTTSEHGVSSITTADAHTSAASSRLNWRPPADLNGLVRFAERLNMVSACVLSHFNWSLPELIPVAHRVTLLMVNFIFVVPCIVILGWRNPTRCNSMQIFIYC